MKDSLVNAQVTSAKRKTRYVVLNLFKLAKTPRVRPNPERFEDDQEVWLSPLPKSEELFGKFTFSPLEYDTLFVSLSFT